MTVSDLDRSVDFYSRVLNFQKVSAAEVAGEPVTKTAVLQTNAPGHSRDLAGKTHSCATSTRCCAH